MTTTLAPADHHLTNIASDAALVDATAASIAVPRARAADSFVLHAPLELLARAALLPMVEPNARDAARSAVRDLETAYQASGPGVDAPSALHSFDDPASAISTLKAAISRGELDDADAAATWLAKHLSVDELAPLLADPILPLLSAAGHGSIFLYQLPRVAPRSRDAARMLRGLVRELARYPGWDLSWFCDLPRLAPSPGLDLGRTLTERLAQPASPGDPGSDFIYPVMSLTETSGLAHDLLHDIVGAITLTDARQTLLRTAAHSMLQDDPSHAPYGWSHCLTMPQAALGIAGHCVEPSHAIAVAATYVAGFRAVSGEVRIDPAWEPARPESAELEALVEGAPAAAAAVAWHTAMQDRSALRAHLASRAAAHHDAHLVKYTLACFDAAHADPEAEPLFLAAAAYLGAWWTVADAAGASG